MRCFSEIAGLDDVVILTASAAKRIAQLEADGAPARLRLQIDGGGCSGFEYKFEVERADAPTDDDDHVFTRDSSVGGCGRFLAGIRARRHHRLPSRR